jgi:predicted nucleotidyltransferase
MVQKCSQLAVLEVFFKEPLSIHFIKGISRQIGLAPTSVRAHVKGLLKEGLIKKRASKPFDGFAANREDEDFIYYKRVYNLYSLKELSRFLVSSLYPKLLVVFGSYSTGEDTETSDIDILVVSKAKAEISPEKFGKQLKRKIHLLQVDELSKLEPKMLKSIQSGLTLYGGF